jgi:hypothetical protein
MVLGELIGGEGEAKLSIQGRKMRLHCRDLQVSLASAVRFGPQLRSGPDRWFDSKIRNHINGGIETVYTCELSLFIIYCFGIDVNSKSSGRDFSESCPSWLTGSNTIRGGGRPLNMNMARRTTAAPPVA